MRDHEIDGLPSPVRKAGEERSRPIRPLLADSFEMWLGEIRGSRAWSGCAFRLFGIDGAVMARTGDVLEEVVERSVVVVDLEAGLRVEFGQEQCASGQRQPFRPILVTELA